MNPAIRTLCISGLIALGVLTLAHPSATRMHTWPWVLVAALVWLLPVALAIAAIAAAREWRLPGPLVTAGLGLLAAATLAAAWAGPFASASLVRVWPALAGVALCFLLHHWLSEPRQRMNERHDRIAALIAAAGAIIIALGFAGCLRDTALAGWGQRNTIPFGHSTYTAGLVVLVMPWLIQRGWLASGVRRAAWLLACLAALIVLASTSSRGGVLALAMVAGVGAIAVLLIARWSLRQKLLVATAAIAIGVVAVFVNPRLRELALQGGWGEGSLESNRQRSAMFDAGILLGQERPLLGWGPGSVPLAYPRMRAMLEGGVDNVLQLHNTPVQIWATLGLAGSAAIVLLIGGTMIAGARAFRRPAGVAHAIPAAASLGGYGIFALTDHQFDLPIIAALAGANLACLTAAAPGVTIRYAPVPCVRAGLAVAIAMLVARPVVALANDLRARHAYEQAVLAWERGHGGDFIAALDRAAVKAPHDPFFQHHAAAALMHDRNRTHDPAQRLELTRAAVARLEDSLAAGVHEEFAHFNLGWLQLESGVPWRAARHFAAAARLVPDKGGVYFGLGLALLEAERSDAAVRAFALEWINDPRSITSPAWEVPALAALRPAVHAEVTHVFRELRTKHPPAAAVDAWTRWWLGEQVPAGELAPGFSRESRAFAATLPAIASRRPIAAGAPWAKLYEAWRDPDSAGAFARVVPRDPALAAALQRRAARHREDFRSFLAAPAEDEPAIVRTYRRQRTGYGVLALHPDGPLLADVYIVQENRVAADFAAGLFPAKGWLPGRFLLALLPPEAAALAAK